MEKKNLLGVITLTLLVLAVGTVMASNNNNNDNGQKIGKNIQITTDPKYERNPCILRTNDGTYWLFYTRGKDNRGIRGLQGYNPDLDYYDIYYRTSKSK